jgi:hypothetical protein
MADTDTPKLDDYARVERLNSATHVFAALASEQFRSGHWVFRGQGSAQWPLLPSLERFARSIVDLPGVIEEYAVREFQRRAHHYANSLPETSSKLEWLALMRHHGSPTRLLDFTKSPYVAAFFAATDAICDDAAAIWAIDALALKKHAAEVLKAEPMSFWVAEIGKKCLEGASFSDPEIFNRLGQGIGPMPSVVAPVEPFRFNERMVLQQGLFLCPFAVGLGLAFEGALVNVLQRARSSAGGGQELLYKLVIEPPAHPHVLRELHRMNVNYASLFPDLDGLARSLSNVSKIRATTVPPPHRPDWEFDMSF